VIFVDSNIPMYLIGADHPRKTDAQRLLERAIVAGEALVTDVEVFQEILHRYVAIDRRDAIAPAWELLTSITDQVVPIDRDDVTVARDLVLAGAAVSARDAIHVAVMRRLGCTHILTFDRGFDAIPGVTRIA
jgi:predicted nucleic acid-binding protein